jgi:nucleoside 2-deoxyribosyltransferase
MTKRFVYLAGPIAGCTGGEANDWREYVEDRLPPGVVGVSPLRCEPIIGERYGEPGDYASHLEQIDQKFGSAKAIASKNMFDVKTCDFTLAYLPREINDRRPSYGTIIEMAWAHGQNIPVILVTDDPYLQQHPVVDATTGWILPTLDDAIEVINGVLTVYTDHRRD